MMMTHYHVALLGIFGNKRVAENVLGLKTAAFGQPVPALRRDSVSARLGGTGDPRRHRRARAGLGTTPAAAVLSPEYGS